MIMTVNHFSYSDFIPAALVYELMIRWCSVTFHLSGLTLNSSFHQLSTDRIHSQLS